jgi:hypothetical protein
MSSTTFLTKDLFSLFDHHIALLERFGLTEEAPFAAIFFSLGERDELSSTEIFENILRKTDALFKIENNFVVMLPMTDWNGADILLKGIQGFLDQEHQDNIVTYPEDGSDSKTLLRKLQQNVEANSGIVVNLIN